VASVCCWSSVACRERLVVSGAEEVVGHDQRAAGNLALRGFDDPAVAPALGALVLAAT
jgi:hypothetical protein